MDQNLEITTKLEKLRASAAAQEALRGVLDDETINATLAAINAQIAALEGSSEKTRQPEPAGGDTIGVGDIKDAQAIAIGCYPVTNAQFRFLVEDGGYEWVEF